jgi:predicted transcriptional regulator
MNENCFRSIYLIATIAFIGIIESTNSFAQLGLQTPVYDINASSDSSRVNFPKPLLPLRNWQDPSDQYFKIKHEGNKLDIYQYISPNAFQTDPFKLDMRGSSYYVPRTVRDELNLIMNRPKDTAFVPILPVAFLALQLASQYLLVQQKTEITPQDVMNAQEGFPILEELWKKNPQTLSELYKTTALEDNFTMLELQKLIGILVDNKLVKRKLIEESETQYFYALEKMQYDHLLERGKVEKNISPAINTSTSVEFKPTKK